MYIDKNDFDGLNAAIYLLVDDGNKATNRPNQAAILSADYTQIGVATDKSTKNTNVALYTANLADAKFTIKSNYSCTSQGVVLATTTVTTPGKPAGAEMLFAGLTTVAALVAALV